MSVATTTDSAGLFGPIGAELSLCVCRDYPDFYKKLYSLLEPSVFHVKYRARFFHLANLFLSSRSDQMVLNDWS